jgi:hypothetical protein
MLIKFYRFSLVAEGSIAPSCSEDSLVIPTAAAGQKKSAMEMIQTLCIIPATFKPSSTNEISGPGRVYFDQGVRFYQLFGLGANLALSYSLCATSSPVARLPGRPIKHLTVQAPTARVSKVSKLSSALVVEDQFVVPDGLDDNHYIIEGVDTPLAPVWEKSPGNAQSRVQNQLLMTVDARRLFKVAFFDSEGTRSASPSSPGQSHTMVECMEQVLRAVTEKRENGLQGTSTMYVIPL